MHENLLYYGDNLDVLRRYVPSDSVDLVYLDPPFNSNQDYNVLFAEQDGTRAAAQIKAFGDTWRWDQGSAHAYEEIVESGPDRVAQVMRAFRTFVGESDMMAYLAMMAPRLVELHRVLKETGSLYLHCDSTASHYLKILLDAVFGPDRFRTEIIWKRTSAHSNAARRFGDQSDSILYYAKGKKFIFNLQYAPYSEKYIKSHYCYVDPDGRRYTTRDMRNPGRRPNLHYEYKGYKPHPNGWSVSLEKMQELDAAGRLYFPTSKDGRIRLKLYLDDMPGTSIGNIWDDIPPINSRAAERLGYPTQKPEALLERILLASSKEGDVVLDPFCGCGTAVSVAQRLNRRWIGIDITHLAISLIRKRLFEAYGRDHVNFEVIGEPKTLPDARALAEQDRHQFQYWALGLVGAGGSGERKKGADRGIDGRLRFHDQPGGKTKEIIFSVKSGHVHARDVRELSDVVRRESAQIGVLLTLEEPTRPMRTEAATGGFYKSPWGDHPRIQILTIADLLDGRGVDFPGLTGANVTFRRAPRVHMRDSEPLDLLQVAAGR